GGEVLQPLLYSLSLEALRNTPVKEARLSFCSATGGYTERLISIDAYSRKVAQDLLGTINSAIVNGFLPAAPKQDGCKWCDFSSICGPHEEIRVSRKDQSSLEALVAIREIR